MISEPYIAPANPVLQSVADALRTARTIGAVAEIRERVKSAGRVSPAERALLFTACAERETEIAEAYLGRKI